MTNYRALLLCVALICGPAAPVLAKDVTADTVVATVGGTEITIGHMIAMTMTLTPDQRAMPVDELFPGVLEQLIQQEAIGKSLGPLSQVALLQLENQRRTSLASSVLNQISDTIVVSPEEVQAAYDRRFANYKPSTEYNASHIVVQTEDEAKAVLAALKDGADFAGLAKEKSIGPSGPGGGHLGWFGPGKFFPAFWNAVVTLTKDEISAPVQTEVGWHIIQLHDSRQPNALTLEQIRGDLEKEVWQMRFNTEVGDRINSVETERNDLTGIDPNVLLDLSLIAN